MYISLFKISPVNEINHNIFVLRVVADVQFDVVWCKTVGDILYRCLKIQWKKYVVESYSLMSLFLYYKTDVENCLAIDCSASFVGMSKMKFGNIHKFSA